MPDGTTGAVAGDYVVPQYTEEGRRITRGAIVGGEQVHNQVTRKIGRMFEAKGELSNSAPKILTPVPVAPLAKTKTRKTKKVVAPVESPAHFHEPTRQPFEEELPLPITASPKSIVVVLRTDFGKIKVAVNAVLESDTGLCLVFKDENQISYEPEQGTEVVITMPDKREIKVMTMGLRFKWYETSQQLMTFIKTEKE